MCGRYFRRATKKAIADWFGVDPEHLPEFGSSFNIAPQTFQLVVRLSPESGEREIVLMYTGRNSTSLLHIYNFARVLGLTCGP
jgi:putative SOS response-associated peptidase YedK